jgi:hypothetical protein
MSVIPSGSNPVLSLIVDIDDGWFISTSHPMAGIFE